MPELPEVETIAVGLRNKLLNATVRKVEVIDPVLRWPVPANLTQLLTAKTLACVDRRSKYLLLKFEDPLSKDCTRLLWHLGMSGVFKVMNSDSDLAKHDKVLIHFANNTDTTADTTTSTLVYSDPRKFGSVHVLPANWQEYKLLATIGPEPLSSKFNVDYLQDAIKRRTMNIKQCLLDNKLVAGIGNIYASEALFYAKILPTTVANSLHLKQLAALVQSIKQVLTKAIAAGGTTLKDFFNTHSQPGYFKQQLAVYDRESEPCNLCATSISKITQAARSTFFCSKCQI